MNDEIKEILTISGRYITNDEKGLILDYITNLQQEKQFVKDCGFENAQQLALDYIGIRQENERLQENNQNMQLEMARSWQRIDKAIEYNKEIVDNYLEEDDCEYCDGRYATAKHNLNILQNGSEKDE